MTPNDQLTDGGPPPTAELPTRCAGPPFGEAGGSASSWPIRATTIAIAAHDTRNQTTKPEAYSRTKPNGFFMSRKASATAAPGRCATSPTVAQIVLPPG